MKIYTIVGGVNGSGKSSLTGVLKSMSTDLGVIIDPDKIAKNMNGNIYLAGKKAVKQIENCLYKNVSFTQESTLAGGYIRKVVREARQRDYYIRLYYVGLDDVQENLDRIANRVRKGGHNIASKDVVRRFETRFEALEKILPYCDEAKFYDNNNGFVEVAEYKNGELIVKTESPSKWLLELKAYLISR